MQQRQRACWACEREVLLTREAIIVGNIVAAIVVAGLVWWLASLRDTWTLGPFLVLCGVICCAMLLIAWLVDRRDAGQKARERSDHASTE